MSRALAALAGVAVAALAACGTPAPGPAVPAVAPAAPVESVAPPPPTPPTTPVELTVPAIDVHTGPLLELGIDADGALEVPPDAATAGWFGLAPAPGSPGPAVIAGHVDYAGAPGVFRRLGELAAGAEVRVARADRSTAVFAVYLVERYAKARFPTERVYGDTADAELRLITCGGAFDGRSGHYQDNVVAYGRLVRVA
ncbi:class F sortase [Pseudonocardia adelaidensis]|uniref:Sortase family protein n=1 Tax=Pseudonocardia adelaidensis TaxID=648754 RepID=A0ABP9NLJ7_9PSEU